MAQGKREEGASSKRHSVAKAIFGLVGSIAVSLVVSWVMPKVQKKVADRIYKKIM